MIYQRIFDFFLLMDKKLFEFSFSNVFAHQDLPLFVDICEATKVCYRRENERLFKHTFFQSVLR